MSPSHTGKRTGEGAGRISDWFSGHRTLRAVIEAVLEGTLGTIATDGAEPRAARLELGCYAVFGGDPRAPDARRLVEDTRPPLELVPPDDQGWRDLIASVHGPRLIDRPMRTFAGHGLDRAALGAAAASLPVGCELVRLDAGWAARLGPALEPHGLQTHPTPEALATSGGFGVRDGGALVSQASAYARSARRLEIAVATVEPYRGRGLARAAAAALIGFCLDAGLSPEWSAANPVSKRLARSLGYRPGPLCDVFFLSGEVARTEP